MRTAAPRRQRHQLPRSPQESEAAPEPVAGAEVGTEEESGVVAEPEVVVELGAAPEPEVVVGTEAAEKPAAEVGRVGERRPLVARKRHKTVRCRRVGFRNEHNIS